MTPGQREQWEGHEVSVRLPKVSTPSRFRSYPRTLKGDYIPYWGQGHLKSLNFLFVFIFQERGRQEETEGEKHQSIASRMLPTWSVT